MRVMREVLILCLLCAATAALPCFYPCWCEADYMNCTKARLDTTLNLSQWLDTFSHKDDIQRIMLDQNSLVHIRPFPEIVNLKYLSLRANRIQKIEPAAFSKLQNLVELDLGYNGLLSVNLQADIFKGQYRENEYQPLEHMEVLRLGGNELHSLKSDVFVHTPHLRVLTLERNPLLRIDVPTMQALTSLQELEVLDLSYTHISVLPQYMLHTPRKLAELNLTGNLFTRVPEELAHAINLVQLRLTSNPITSITADTGFPDGLQSVKVLEMNWMTNLTSIEGGSMSSLVSLEELYCSHNHKLETIHPDAFRQQTTNNASHIWPPVKKLHIRSNKLSYLDESLLGNWEGMEEIDIQDNEWMCDCENQWMVSKLEPIIKRTRPEYAVHAICSKPEEMRGKRMFDLQTRHYHMRCLDSSGNHPEQDGSLLIGALVGVLVAVPITVGLLIFFRHRLPFLRSGPAAYSRAFYKAPDDY